jgi:hypothetical protein
VRVGAVEPGELRGGVDRLLGGGQGPLGVLLAEPGERLGEELLLLQPEGGDEGAPEGGEDLFGCAPDDGLPRLLGCLRGGAGAVPGAFEGAGEGGVGGDGDPFPQGAFDLREAAGQPP